MKQMMIFMYGMPASGKTTFSKEYAEWNKDVVRIGSDDIRKELYGSEDCYGDPLECFHVILEKMRQTLSEGKSFIYDAVNMKQEYRMDFLNNLTDFDVDKYIIHLDIDRNTCQDRFLKRPRNIPFDSVEGYFYMNEYPSYSEGWKSIIRIKDK